jgi:hypothetical protein
VRKLLTRLDDWKILAVFGGFFGTLELIRTRRIWDQVANLRVPVSILWWLLAAALVRQRRDDQIAADNAKAAEALGAEVGQLVVQGDRRADELLVLQQKVTTLTSWLVFLTVVIILLGVGSIVATVAAS